MEHGHLSERCLERECSMRGIVFFLFLLKTSPKVVSSSFPVGVWVIKVGAFLFFFKDSLGMLAATLIFLASSTSSAMLMLGNILFTKKTSKWLITVAELFSPRVGNVECKLSEHRGCTLWSTSRRCLKKLQVRQELTDSLIFWRKIFQAPITLEFRFRVLVKGKFV